MAGKMERVCVVASANDLYVPYLSVMMRSVMEYFSKERELRFIVLHTDITDAHQQTIKLMVEELENMTVDFIDVTYAMRDYKDLFISNHIKIETYFRLLLPEFLPDEKKILYIDCDVIANSDVYDLYNVDLEDNFLAGARDADSAANYNTDPKYKEYIDNVLKLTNPYDYLQAGIIVMNLDKFRAECSTEKLLDTAMSRKWTFHDQDTLNFLCKNHIKFVDYEWNFVYDYNEEYRRSKNVIVNAPHYIMSDYMRAKEKPKMIHFSWVDKPWYSPGVHFGEKFWMIARKSPFYSEMLFETEVALGNWIKNN